MPEEIQPTAPDIPVKNKASVLASERKFRDTEVNKILAAFQKVDQNFSALLEEILNISLTPGPEGKTAYQVAVEQGFVGSQSAWLASLVGAPGAASVMTRASSTSLAVGTGSKTFTYANAANLGWTVGMRLRATSGANFMEGVVDSVSSTVVTLIVDLIGGSGTHASWNIGIAGSTGDYPILDVNAGNIRWKLSQAAAGAWTNLFNLLSAIETEVQAVTREAHPDQVKEIGLFATFVSPFVKETMSVQNPYSIDFTITRERGTRTDPMYRFLDFVRENALREAKSVLMHSSDRVPDIFLPLDIEREVHQRFYTAESQMLSDQANQVAGKGYLLNTSYYIYNGVANGLITDYTLVASGTTRGKKPSWLFVEGEYLVGTAHLNEITAMFKPIHKVGEDVHFDVVICSIVNVPNGNLDSNKPDLGLIGKFDLNENPQNIPSLEDLFFVDSSFYSFLDEPGQSAGSMINPEYSVVVDLGGGQYAYRIGNDSVSSGSLKCFMSFRRDRISLKAPWTIVIRVRKWTGDSGTGTLNTNLIGNVHMAENSGGLKVFFSSQGTPRVSIGPTSLNGGQVSANEARGSDSNMDAKISSAEARTFVISFDGTNVSFKRNNNVEYLTSNISAFAGRTAESKHPLQIGRNIDGSSPTDVEIHYIRFFSRILSSTEILVLP